MTAINYVWELAGGLTGLFLAGLLVTLGLQLPEWGYPLLGGGFALSGVLVGLIFSVEWELRH